MAARVNPGAGPSTDRFIVNELVKDPKVPTTVTGYMPAAVPADAASVSVALVSELGAENEAVTPAGSPLTEKLTTPVKPFRGMTSTSAWPVWGALSVRVNGFTAMLKGGWFAEPPN